MTASLRYSFLKEKEKMTALLIKPLVAFKKIKNKTFGSKLHQV